MKVHLPKEAQAIVAMAGKDESRPVLKTICVRGDVAAACDGFVMATVKVEVTHDLPVTQPVKELLIPTKLIEAMRNADKNHARDYGITFEEKDSLVYAEIPSWGEIGMSMKPIEGSYPAFEHLFPHTPFTGVIGLSSYTLKALLTVMAQAGSGTVMFRVRDGNLPVEFITGEVHGLIMPIMLMRDGENELWSEIKEDVPVPDPGTTDAPKVEVSNADAGKK